MILGLLRLCSVLLCFAIAGEALAAQPPAPPPGPQIPAVDPAALGHLIQTLQDPKSRDQFISDLKALQVAQRGATPAPVPPPNALGARLLQAMSDAFDRLRAGIEDLRASVGDPSG